MRQFTRNLALGLSVCAAWCVQAQTPVASTWPTKSIKIIVTYPTAGVSDNATRVLAERLTKSLGQSVLVENRAGAGGTLGADVVAKAAPDGYTIGFAGISAFSIGPHVMKVNYASVKEFPAGASRHTARRRSHTSARRKKYGRSSRRPAAPCVPSCGP